MILPDFKAFPKKGRVVGIDWGARRVGVAISDADRQIVFVRPVVDSGKASDEILRIVMDENVVGIVLGLPLYSDGTESETTVLVRNFANELSNKTDLPIVFIDESFSSVYAQESMGWVRVHDIKQKLDSESARVILENAIAVINRN